MYEKRFNGLLKRATKPLFLMKLQIDKLNKMVYHIFMKKSMVKPILLIKAEEKDVQAAFDIYEKQPTSKNLLELVKAVTANELHAQNIPQVRLNFERLEGIGGYQNGNLICINTNKFSLAWRKKAVFNVLECLFHEIKHLKMSMVNNEVINTGENVELYIEPYPIGFVRSLFLNTSRDSGYIRYATDYLYYKSPNEKKAREFGYYKALEYVKKFGKKTKVSNKTFEESEEEISKNFRRDFSEYIGLEDIVLKDIDFLQQRAIVKGVDKLENDQTKFFKMTYDISLSDEFRKLLIKECLRSTDTEKALDLLKSPLLKLTTKEYKKVCNRFGEKANSLFLENNFDKERI